MAAPISTACVGDRRLGDAVGPELAPPRAVFGRGEAPRGRAGLHVGEAGGVRPREEEPARVGFAVVGAGDRVVHREPRVELGVGRVPRERRVVAVARGDDAAGLAHASHLAQRARPDRAGVAAPGARARCRTCRRRSRARTGRRCGTRRWSRPGRARSASAASIAAGAASMPITCAGRDAVRRSRG